MGKMRAGWVRGWLVTVVLAVMSVASLAGAENLGSWLRRMPITFSGYTPPGGTTALENFPVLVVVSNNIANSGFDYATFLSPPYGDLRFAAADQTTPLDFEVESWDTTGASYIWVKVPELTATTTIYVLWGMNGVVPPSCTTNGAVWGDAHLGVWHMENFDDATGRLSPTVNSGTTATQGVAGGGRLFNSPSYIELPANLRNTGATNAFAVSLWFKSSSAVSDLQCLMEDGTAHSTDSIYLFANNLKKEFAAHMRNAAGATVQLDTISVPTLDTDWHALAHVYDGATIRTYIDGVQHWSSNISGMIASGNTKLHLGRRPGGAYYFTGIMDEVRVSGVARSDDWIWAEYKNTAANGEFNVYGRVATKGISVVGNGYAIADRAPAMAITGTDFGVVLTNDLVLDRTFTITNAGEVAFALTASPPVAVKGGAGGFTLLTQPTLTEFHPGDAADFTLRFAPEAVGWYKASVVISNDYAELEGLSFNILGYGDSGAALELIGANNVIIDTGAAASVDNGSDFGTWSTRSESGLVNIFTITNKGIHTLLIEDIGFSGSAAFNLAEPFAATAVAPGATTSFGVLFASMIALPHEGEMVIRSNTKESPARFQLKGVVTTPLLSLKTQSYVDLEKPEKLLFADNQPLTIEAWVKYDDISGAQMIYSKNNGRGSTYSHMFGIYNGTSFYCYSGERGSPANQWLQVAFSPALVVGRWYHITFSFDGTNLKCFINGVLRVSQSFSYGCNATHNAKIGGYNDSTGTKGLIYDLRLWDHARSAEKILATALVPPNARLPGTVAHWLLDEGEGTSVADGARPPANGTLLQEAGWVDATMPTLSASGTELLISGHGHLYGSPEPPYGAVTGLAHGSNFVCSVQADPQYHEIDGRYRGICSGYLWYTNATCAPVAGSGTTFSYTHESSYPMSLLVWQWDDQYEMKITAGAGGSVTTGTSWLVPDTTVTTTAVADEGARFLYWVGDVTEEQRFATTITITSDVPRAVEARFTLDSNVQYVAPAGSDGNDGLSWATAKRGINAAMDAILDHSVVYVAGGHYPLTETIGFNARTNIVIRGGYEGVSSEEPAGEHDIRRWLTTIDGGGNCRAVLLESSAGITLDGLKLQGGYVAEGAAGAGIKIVSSDNINVLNTIIADSVVGAVGGTVMGLGAYVEQSGVVFSNVAFRGNSMVFQAAHSRGGGAAVYNGMVEFHECLFHDNHLRSSGAHGVFGGGLYLEGGNHIVENSVFSANGTLSSTLANAWGDGLHVGGAATTVTAFNNLFSGNMRDAIHLENGTLVVSYATITTHGRYGVRRVNGTLTISDSIVWQCAEPTSGTMTIDNCMVDVDPLFEYGLYLGSGSPAIDGGSDVAAVVGLGGRPTVVGAPGDSGDADLGYHFNSGEFSWADDMVRFDPQRAVLYVDTANGDDAGEGGEDTPFKTLTHALNFARGGSRIELAAGEYSAANEVFPLVFDKPGIRLTGAGAGTSIINAARNSTTPGRVAVLRGMTGDALVKGVTFCGGYLANAPSTLLAQLAENYWHPRYGAGLQILSSAVVLDDITVANNEIVGRADDDCRGAGVYAFYSWVTLRESFIADNTISGRQPNNGVGYGGGLYLNGGYWQIYDSMLTRNSAGLQNYGGNCGGAIAMYGKHVVSNCTIAANNLGALNGYKSSIVRYGSGVYMDNGFITDCYIASNTIVTADSTSTVNGGGVYMSGGTLRNSLVFYNQAWQAAGGVYASGGLIENVTATGNYSVELDSVAGVQLAGNAVVSNSIFYGNICRFDESDISLGASGGTVAHSCIYPYRAGEGNTDGNPEFADPLNGDFTPMPGSSVIDKAIEHEWMANAQDMAGNARIRGSAPDMGAYESLPPDEGSLGVNFVADVTQGSDQLAVTFTAFAYGVNSDDLTYYWDFNGDGVPEVLGKEKGEVAFVFTPGYYTVGLAITNDQLQGAMAYKKDYIWVSSSEIYVWSGGSGGPGTSWATAFTNLHEAINFARGTNTFYLAGEQFDLSDGLVLSSLDNVKLLGGYKAGAETVGPGEYDFARWPTLLCRPGGAAFRVLTIAFLNDLVIERVVVTGSNMPSLPTKVTGGGVNIIDSTVTIVDCVVSNNQSNSGNNSVNWGGGIYLGRSKATIRRTLIAANTAKTTAANYNGTAVGGGLAAENSAVSISECQFIGNHSDCNGLQGSLGGAIYTSGGSVTVRSSLFVNNSAGRNYACSQGGAAYINSGTIMENCTIVANTCRNSAYYATTAGGVYSAGGYVANTLVIHNTNTATAVTSDVYAANLNSFAHCRAEELEEGENGNTTADPLLMLGVDSKKPYYSLQYESPLRNAGVNQPWMVGALDLAGGSRIAEGRVDIGAYEIPARRATIILLR